MTAKTDVPFPLTDYLRRIEAAEHDLKIYDIAALVPIVEQAGGQFSALLGELTPETSSVLATNGKLHGLSQQAFG